MRLGFLVMLLVGFTCYSQNDLEKISWKPEPLVWDNFKGQPDATSPFKANTNTGISYGWGLKNTNGVIEITYEISSNFYPDLSWVAAGSKNERLLKHEQLHFDISELHARKLRKKLSELDVAQLGKNPKEKLNAIYEVIDRERNVMQLRFDKESNHSINIEGEERWQKFVKQELEKLQNFS